MATPGTKIQFSGLARKLVHDGLITDAQAQEAFEAATKKNIPFVTHLVENKITDSRSIAQSAAEEFGVPLLDIDVVDLEPDVVKLVKEDLIRKHHSLPLFKRGNRLFIAVSDPTNLQALDEIKFHVGMSTEAILVQDDKLARTIDKALEAADTSLSELADSDLDDVEFVDEDTLSAGGDVSESEADDTPVVRFVNKVLLDAINKGASDIHFEPYEKNYRVRFRTDGILREVVKPPRNLAPRLSARLKVMSQMDISERRVPQDGRILMKLSRKRAIDFRVNTLPTLFGEKIVLRILDASAAMMGIDALGYEPFQKQLYTDALAKPQGMILVTGKTGSGKSTTLAAMIDAINTKVKGHILTIEDPIEFVHERKNCLISQREVGMHTTSFSDALHSALREDPNVILVGELRDLETMSTAITAAEMGILVMATLHTNGAAAAVDRMVNAFPADKQGHVRTMLSTSLRGVLSQQLVLHRSGRGRVCALEILINTPAVSNLIRQGKIDQLENAMQSGAAQGMRTMDSAIQQLLDSGTISGRSAYEKAINKSKFEQVKDID